MQPGETNYSLPRLLLLIVIIKALALMYIGGKKDAKIYRQATENQKLK